MIVIKKGIDLPISGAVTNSTIQTLETNANIGIVGDDYLGLKPTMLIAEGDHVQEGQALFEDKKNPGVQVTAPVSGEILAIERGERRRLLSVIIRPDTSEAKTFSAHRFEEIANLDSQAVRDLMVESGTWTYLRQRPFEKIPAIDSTPHAIFVNTMDSNPLAIDPMLAFAGREEDYQAGLAVLAKLTDGAVHVAHSAEAKLPQAKTSTVKYHAFGGIHPAGLVGTHIHFIDPVGMEKRAWHIDLQDLLALGHLFLTGKLDNFRVISVVGPGVQTPQLLKVRRGINLTTLLENNLHDGEQRVISGSVFSGRQAEKPIDFLGVYHRQVVVLPEGRDSIFLEFVRPGNTTYSRTRAYLGRFLGKPLRFTTSLQGSPRPILPFGIYEEVMPLDILPTMLLKALAVKDTDNAVALGALELAEEDIALLTYVDPGKHDFGAILRENLTQIEEEG